MEKKQLFSEELRKRLAGGKYTQWATNLTEDTLEALLWMVGEYGCRVSEQRFLNHDWTIFAEHPVLAARIKTGLETISRIVQFEESLDVEEAKRRIRDAVASAYHIVDNLYVEAEKRRIRDAVEKADENEIGLDIIKCPDCKQVMKVTQKSQRIVYSTKKNERDEMGLSDHYWCHRCQLYLYIRRHLPAPHTGEKQ